MCANLGVMVPVPLIVTDPVVYLLGLPALQPSTSNILSVFCQCLVGKWNSRRPEYPRSLSGGSTRRLQPRLGSADLSQNFPNKW